MIDDPCDDWLCESNARRLIYEERVRAKRDGDRGRTVLIKTMLNWPIGGKFLEAWKICLALGLFKL